MKPTQPTLPTLPDWTQPQTLAASQLASVLAQATAAGFRATGFVVTPTGYRVTFERIGRLSHAERSKKVLPGVF